ncbi:hypothetical protein [Simplicispira lacusdiani]|uniref:hypothetical protein n=1 Tax=Simplicispira lacusdiani TaxID=2213010 RepID=UPI000E712FA2|nr:hypothetical protein [Simplicispira lacusdiani]
MSDEAAALRWSVVEPVDGVRVHGYFFVQHMFATHDAVRKTLPIFSGRLPEPVHVGESEFRLGRLVGRPSALFQHGTGFLSLTQAAESEDHTSSNWRELLRPEDIWIALANAAAVSTAMRKPAAAMLRAGGALYFLAPTDEALQKVLHALAPTEESGLEPMSPADVARLCMDSKEAP